MRIRLVAGMLVLAARPALAEVEVRVAGNRVSLHADSAPVSEVLDSLARQAGIRLIYDAPPPRQTLTARIEDRTPAEAVLAVLEGLGLNYALVMDRSGTMVDQLLILGTPGATSSSGAAAGRPTPQAPGHRAPPSRIPDFVPETDGEDANAEGELDPMEALGQIEAEEEAQTPPAQAAAPSAGPPPPEYPNSPFSPRLPLPTPPPAPSPQASPAPPSQ